MISNYNNKQQKNKKQKHFNNCLLKSVKTKLLSLDNSTTKTILKTTMSSMTADLIAADLNAAAAAGKVAKISTMKPPMEAVVVNSIIYSKPSFCSIVVDLGGGSIAREVPMAKDKWTKLPNGCCANKIFTNEGFNQPKMGIKPTSLTSFTSACLTSVTCAPPPTPSMAAQTKDAQVYSLCTTMNGSIHHQISDLCDNILAMTGLFGNATNEHDSDDDDDDDSLIEFAYDGRDYIDGMESEEDTDDDEETDDEETDDDDIDIEFDHNFNGYGDDDDYLDADKDIVDFSYECLKENAPILKCDKRKKVRFNTKPTVHVMHTWDYAYRAARKGQWEMYARDRERFRFRVQRASLLLNPILEREHRQKVYEKRFVNIADHFDDGQKQLQYPLVGVKPEVKQNAEKSEALKEKKTESKNIYQKKKRKKRRRFCRMGNKHYF